MCRLVAAQLAAFLATVDDDIPPLGIRHGAHRLQRPTAGVGAISGVDVHVQAPKAKGAMVARGIAEGLHLPAAMRADKSIVVFGKSFIFHLF